LEVADRKPALVKALLCAWLSFSLSNSSLIEFLCDGQALFSRCGHQRGQGFSFTKQAIYHVSHTFQNELEFICALVILEMGSANYLPVLASNPDPPDLSLPRS
jgi:hypothetical protein